jgi:hypothetical protein
MPVAWTAGTVHLHDRPFLVRPPRDDPGYVRNATDLTLVHEDWVAPQSGAG